MKKYLILFVVLALMVPMIASAQSAGNTENRIFGVHFGFVGGYDLDPPAGGNDVVAGRDFGLNFTLSESMQIGFRSISDLLTTGDASLLNFGYYLSPQLGIDLMVGSDGTSVVGGVDAAFYLFKSNDEVISSSLKMKAGYIFDEASGIDSGVINAGLIGTVGY